MEKFENFLTGLNPSKMIQVSMDRPSVNLKFLESLCNLRESERLPGLIDIDLCQLHAMHGAFQTGAVKSKWNIHKTLKAVWQILHDSAARSCDYISVTGSTSFLFKGSYQEGLEESTFSIIRSQAYNCKEINELKTKVSNFKKSQ